MNRINNIIFDLGGVVITLAPEKAIGKFKKLGLKNADRILDSYTQGGIFGELELGNINEEQFIQQLSVLCGKKLTYEQCLDAWLGYCKELPVRNLKALKKLRGEGYRLILLSNTNPFMMKWAESDEFDGIGHPIGFYFDAVYASYKLGVMKPDPNFFRRVLMNEGILPQNTLFLDDGPRNVAVASQLGIHTFCPVNGEDWTKDIYKFLNLELNSKKEENIYPQQLKTI